jgi:hypothetical protein
MKLELTKKQKAITLIAIVVAISFLVFSCGNAVSNEVKTDSTFSDTTLVDSVKIDTLK